MKKAFVKPSGENTLLSSALVSHTPQRLAEIKITSLTTDIFATNV